MLPHKGSLFTALLCSEIQQPCSRIIFQLLTQDLIIVCNHCPYAHKASVSVCKVKVVFGSCDCGTFCLSEADQRVHMLELD